MARKTGGKGAFVRFPGANPWVDDPRHVGEMTVRQLVGLVMTDEFPNGLDTRIVVGDTEGNEGVNATFCVTTHKPGDVVLSTDMHCGDEYDPEEVSDEQP